MKIYLFLCVLLLAYPMRVMAVNFPHIAGARSSAMAQSSVMLSDEWSGVNNQAGTAFYDHTSFGASYKSLFLTSQIGIKHALLNLRTTLGMVGINYQQLNYGGYYDTKAGSYYARKFGEKFSAGLQFDLLMIKPSYEEEMVYNYTGEVSIMAQTSKKLCIGFHLYNPFAAIYETTYFDEKVPVVARLGLKYSFSDQLFISFEGLGQSDEMPNFKTGFEYTVAKSVAIRGGAASQPIQISFGAGVVVQGFRVDMSIQQVEKVGRSASFSISYAF